MFGGRPIAGLNLNATKTVAGSPAAGDTASKAGTPPLSSSNTSPKPPALDTTHHSPDSAASIATPKPVVGSGSPSAAASVKKQKSQSALSLQLDEQLKQAALARAQAQAASAASAVDLNEQASDLSIALNVKPDGTVVIHGMGDIAAPSPLIRETSIDPRAAAAQPTAALTAQQRQEERKRLLKEAREKREKADALRRGTSAAPQSRATQRASKKPALTAVPEASAVLFAREEVVVPVQAQSALAEALAVMRPPKAAVTENASAAVVPTPSPAISTLDDDEIKKRYLALLELEGKNKDQKLSLNNPNQTYLLLKAKAGFYQRLQAASNTAEGRIEADEFAVMEHNDWVSACKKIENFTITNAEAEKVMAEAKRQKAVAAAAVSGSSATVTRATRERGASAVSPPPQRDANKYTDDGLVNLYVRLLTIDGKVTVDSIVYDEAKRGEEFQHTYSTGDEAKRAAVLKKVKIGLYIRLLNANDQHEAVKLFLNHNDEERYGLVKSLIIVKADADLLLQKAEKNRAQRDQEESAKEADIIEKQAREFEEKRAAKEKAARELALARMTVKERRQALQPALTPEQLAHKELKKKAREANEQKREEARQQREKSKKAAEDRARQERQKQDKVLESVKRMNGLLENDDVEAIFNVHFNAEFEQAQQLKHKTSKKKKKATVTTPVPIFSTGPAPLSPVSGDEKFAARPANTPPHSALPISLSAPADSSMPSSALAASKSSAVITKGADGGINMDLVGDSNATVVSGSSPISIRTASSTESASDTSSNSSSGIAASVNTPPNTPVVQQAMLAPPVAPSWKMPSLFFAGLAATAVGVFFYGVGALPGIIMTVVGGGTGLITGIKYLYDSYQYSKQLEQYLANYYNKIPSIDSKSSDVKETYELKDDSRCKIKLYKNKKITVSMDGVNETEVSDLAGALMLIKENREFNRKNNSPVQVLTKEQLVNRRREVGAEIGVLAAAIAQAKADVVSAQNAIAQAIERIKVATEAIRNETRVLREIANKPNSGDFFADEATKIYVEKNAKAIPEKIKQLHAVAARERLAIVSASKQAVDAARAASQQAAKIQQKISDADVNETLNIQHFLKQTAQAPLNDARAVKDIANAVVKDAAPTVNRLLDMTAVQDDCRNILVAQQQREKAAAKPKTPVAVVAPALDPSHEELLRVFKEDDTNRSSYTSEDTKAYRYRGALDIQLHVTRHKSNFFSSSSTVDFVVTNNRGMPVNVIKDRNGNDIKVKDINGLRSLLDILPAVAGGPGPGVAPAVQPAAAVSPSKRA